MDRFRIKESLAKTTLHMAAMVNDDGPDQCNFKKTYPWPPLHAVSAAFLLVESVMISSYLVLF